MRRVTSIRKAANLAAIAIAVPCLAGCAQLHLTQDPHQVLQRTASEDNYDARQPAGPTAARVLPYALLAEQTYEPSVYALHRMAPRATGCIADDPAGCDLLWRFEACGRLAPSVALRLELRRARALQGADAGPERACRRPRRPGLGAEGRTMSGSGRRLSRNRRRQPGRLGVQLSLDISARFPSTTNTIRSATTSATSSAISSATNAIGGVQPRSRRSGTRSAAALPSSRPTPIRESAGSTRSIPRW